MLADRRGRAANSNAQLAIQKLVREFACQSLELFRFGGGFAAQPDAHALFGRTNQKDVATIDEQIRSAVDRIERIQILVDLELDFALGELKREVDGFFAFG